MRTRRSRVVEVFTGQDIRHTKNRAPHDHPYIQYSCLILQSLRGDHEVEQGHLYTDLWEVVRIPQLRSNVKSEIIAAVIDQHEVRGIRRRDVTGKRR